MSWCPLLSRECLGGEVAEARVPGPGERGPAQSGQAPDTTRTGPGRGRAVRAVVPDELVEVRWLSPTQVHELMPDLFDAVRDHLDRQPL
jgi:hypothetical protein